MNYERTLYTRNHRLIYVTFDQWHKTSTYELHMAVLEGEARRAACGVRRRSTQLQAQSR